MQRSQYMEKNYLGYLQPEDNQITKKYNTPCPSHNHILWELVFFFDGLAQTKINDKTYEVSPGDVFLIGPPHLHAIRPLSENPVHQDVYFQQDDLEKAFCNLPPTFRRDILSGERVIHFKLSGDNFGAAIRFCENLLKFSLVDSPLGATSTREYQKYLSISLLSWITGLYVFNYSDRHTKTPAWLVNFINELQKPEVFSMRVNDIVALTNYSHSQVGTIFKNYKGVSLVDYLIATRMNYARELLETTDKSVLTISQECGYNSLSTFIKTFREKFGCSPLKYRNIRNREPKEISSSAK